MKATVVVKPAGSAVPKTPDQVKAQALRLQTAAYPKAIALNKTKVGGAQHRRDGRRRRRRDDRLLPEGARR